MKLASAVLCLLFAVLLRAADPPAPALPQFASATDIKIIWQENVSPGHGEILRLRFETKRSFNGHASDGVSQFFEKQLAAAGWHQSEADTSNEVFVSAW
jgi:hypothetical protein